MPIEPSRYYLGIDGGQSSTVALISDETGRVLGTGTAGPCNHVAAPEAEAKFLRVVSGCVDEARMRAGLASEPIVFRAACLGFSGGAADKERLSRQIIPAAKYHVTHDAEIALSGATAGEPGVIVIAGTGSMAFGRNAAGISARAGGWGFVFGDEGGAFDLVRQALRAALRFEEGWGPGTVLRDSLLAATQSKTVNDALHAFYSPAFPRDRIASLAPLVDQAAEDGDTIACQIVDRCAEFLAEYAGGVYRTLFTGGEQAAICPVGGVFRSASLKSAFARHIYDVTGQRMSTPRFSPAVGALLQALRMNGRQELPTGDLIDSE
jgi:N-acetylglucosamine kinase-like BadF-type ATPase